jgi:hypothetical protein
MDGAYDIPFRVQNVIGSREFSETRTGFADIVDKILRIYPLLPFPETVRTRVREVFDLEIEGDHENNICYHNKIIFFPLILPQLPQETRQHKSRRIAQNVHSSEPFFSQGWSG